MMRFLRSLFWVATASLISVLPAQAYEIGVPKGKREHVATFNCPGTGLKYCRVTICLTFKNRSDGQPALVHHWRKIAWKNETKDLARALGSRCLKYEGSSSYYVDVMPIEQDIIVTVADEFKPK